MAKFYLTTAIPYVNGKPHIGHTLEYFQADTVRRYQQLLGKKTLMLSGADENALKNVQAAEKEDMPIQEFLDKSSEVWKKAYADLDIPLDVFQRGSDQKKHWPGVQKLWELCVKNGDIYKKAYTGLYCVGCESFKTEKELVNGLCPEHQKAPEKIIEENYFFKLSAYQDKLLELIESYTLKIIPENKRQETISFIKQGLEDFSVSRSKERARGVGVPIPNDLDQVMYVWFDALNIYMTGIGFGWDDKTWKKWWPADLHVIGKDINRFHTIYWPAMLMSAGLPLPKAVLIHGFVYTKGEKMSKSVGNVIDPFEVAKTYGVESIRYYMLSQIPIDNDGDFTEERFKEVYNADLANGIGNLIARVAALCEQSAYEFEPTEITIDKNHPVFKELAKYNFTEALKIIWQGNIHYLESDIKEDKEFMEDADFWESISIKNLDKNINEKKPWTLEGKEKKDTLQYYIDSIRKIAFLLQPFLPDTSKKILEQFKGSKIVSSKPLFPRI
ncbi:MAG: methionine--tRNA ligase [Candidatus Levyibacteriota bacterium]